VIASVWLCTGRAMPANQLPAWPKDEVAAEQRKQQIDQMRDYYAALARVDDVGFHIRVSNRQFCKKVGPDIGLYSATVQSLPPRKYHSYADEALKLSWTKPTALAVASGSPAAVAGIKAGDQHGALDRRLAARTWRQAGRDHGAARRRRYAAHGLSCDVLRHPGDLCERSDTRRLYRQ